MFEAHCELNCRKWLDWGKKSEFPRYLAADGNVGTTCLRMRLVDSDSDVA